jgi:hypothetical protein
VTRARKYLWPALFWLAVLAFSISSYSLTNDHFGRIAPARQIARYGALPFRDYFDPGYFLTELSSAALQRAFGDNLLGELLLNTTFIATGSLLVLVLARRLSGATAVAIIAAVVALFAGPREYDYDKVLFYPLGLFFCWRYFVRPQPRALAALAAAIVVAGLYRYDNGVYLAAAAVVGIVALHGLRAVAARHIAWLAGATVVFSAPFLLFVQLNGGLANAVDQMWTYGLRESARTRISSLPHLPLSPVIGMAPLSRGSRVSIRWAASVDALQRARKATALGLADEMPDRPDRRTWTYLLTDTSSAHIRRIVNDPSVEDTGGIDRARSRLEHPAPFWLRYDRQVPLLRLRFLPRLWDPDGAGAALYYVFLAIPIAATLLLVAVYRSEDRPSPAVVALLSATVTMAVITDALILRDPVGARVGGMAGPPAILCAWMATHLPRRPRWARVSLRVAGALIFAMTLGTLAIVGDWPHRVIPQLADPAILVANAKVLSQTPPSLTQLPASRIEGLITYVHDCTQPTDRVYASWFFPELYVLAQRGFAGGLVATFGQHWSEPRFQARSVRWFESQSVPIVILDTSTYNDFHDWYPLISDYFAAHYRVAGESNFGDPTVSPHGYRVLVRRDRSPVRVDSRWGLACFA